MGFSEGSDEYHPGSGYQMSYASSVTSSRMKKIRKSFRPSMEETDGKLAKLEKTVRATQLHQHCRTAEEEDGWVDEEPESYRCFPR